MSKQNRAPRKRLTPDQIAGIVREVEHRTAQGQSVGDSCRALGVAEPSYYRWRAASEKGDAGPRRLQDDLTRTRNAILEAAKNVFLRSGYEASLAHVAAAAGVARQTVYNQFGSKERLFTDVVKMIYERVVRPVVVIEAGDDLVAALNAYGRRYLTLALDPESIALQRVTVAEHRKYPELSGIAFALRASHALPTLGEEISARLRVEMERGTIDSVDPDVTSLAFCGCLFGPVRQRALAGVHSPPDENEALLRTTVNIFARGLNYRPVTAKRAAFG